MSAERRPLRVVLWGDGESPHLLKWARALAPRVELHVASSRGLGQALAALVPAERCLLLGQATKFDGGNAALLKALPRLVRWLRAVDADWVNAHYVTSHGTLAWLARKLGVRAQLAASAWGSDILVTPKQSRLMRWVVGWSLRRADLITADSMDNADGGDLWMGDGDTPRDLAQDLLRRGVRDVLQLGDTPTLVVVADHPVKTDAGTGGKRRQGAHANT